MIAPNRSGGLMENDGVLLRMLKLICTEREEQGMDSTQWDAIRVSKSPNYQILYTINHHMHWMQMTIGICIIQIVVQLNVRYAYPIFPLSMRITCNASNLVMFSLKLMNLFHTKCWMEKTKYQITKQVESNTSRIGHTNELIMCSPRDNNSGLPVSIFIA